MAPKRKATLINSPQKGRVNMDRDNSPSKIVILRLSPEKLKLFCTEDGGKKKKKILVDDHTTEPSEPAPDAGSTERADRSATGGLTTHRTHRTHPYSLRLGRHSRSSSSTPTSLAPSLAPTANHEDPSSSRASSLGRPSGSHSLRPNPRPSLKIKLHFSDRPSVLRQRTKKVAFNDTPQVKHISPRRSSSSSSSEDSSASSLSDDSSDFLSDSSPSDSPTPQANKMAESGRPKLKLSLSQINKNDLGSSEALGPNSAGTPGGPLKLKLNLNKSTPATAESSTPAAKSKKKKKNVQVANGATPGSSAKKRKISQAVGNDEPSSDELGREHHRPVKKVRIIQKPNTPSTPAAQMLKIKHKGKVPKRPLGSGYDSELEDREDDPTILEGLIFRMLPGEHANQIRKAIEDNKIGIPRSEGGLDIRFTFFAANGRRGMVEIKGTKYATAVVDLPCIIEGMKSWDKKGWVKSIDVSQMLLVLGQCGSVEEAQDYPLPPEIDKEFKYAHGITPPMKNVRKRRFNRTKRTSISAIEAVERRVNQLLADDEEALDSTYEIIDHDRLTQERSRLHSTAASDEEDDEEDASEDEDAEGDEDVEGDLDGQEPVTAEAPADDEDEDIDMDLVEGMLQDDDVVLAPDAAQAAANESSFVVTSASASPAVQSPAQTPQHQTEDDASGDESQSDEDALDDDDNAAEVAERQERREKLEEIEESLKKAEEDFKKATNPFLKNKMEPKIKSLRETRAQLREELGLDE